jgi:hypothetical protein
MASGLMKLCWGTTAALVCLATVVVEQLPLIAQSGSRMPATPSFDGTWEGKMNDLPAIELKIDDSSGKVNGTIIFYFQERSNPNEPWHVSGGTPGPLLVPHVDGTILTFEVQHHKCHGCAELGPNVRFRVQLAGPSELRLWKLGNQDATKDPGPGLKLVHRVEPASPSQPAQSPPASRK